jgi:hypothetical protein
LFGHLKLTFKCGFRFFLVLNEKKGINAWSVSTWISNRFSSRTRVRRQQEMGWLWKNRGNILISRFDHWYVYTSISFVVFSLLTYCSLVLPLTTLINNWTFLGKKNNFPFNYRSTNFFSYKPFALDYTITASTFCEMMCSVHEKLRTLFLTERPWTLFTIEYFQRADNRIKVNIKSSSNEQQQQQKSHTGEGTRKINYRV